MTDREASRVCVGIPWPIGGDGCFRLFVGRSGRRFVFTRLDETRAGEDLDGAVVILARVTREGPLALWIGPAERMPEGIAAGVEIWAHWLAETPAARRAVVADLLTNDGDRCLSPVADLRLAA